MGRWSAQDEHEALRKGWFHGFEVNASATEPGETYSYWVIARRRGEVDSQPSAVWAIAIPTKELVKPPGTGEDPGGWKWCWKLRTRS